MPPGSGGTYVQRHDRELCAAAAAGDGGAFGELVRRHGSGVRALLRRMGAPAHEADDVAQDAFMAAFERMADFRGEGSFAGWVKRIAVRLWLRRLQRDRRLQNLVADDGATQADASCDADGRMDLDAALQALSPAERLCVSLCHGAGLSHPETAEALKLPLGTVKSHVKRGVEKLRAQLAPAGRLALEGRQGHG